MVKFRARLDTNIQARRGNTMEKARVGLIGLGFGSEFIPIYKAHPKAEVAAICQIVWLEEDAGSGVVPGGRIGWCRWDRMMGLSTDALEPADRRPVPVLVDGPHQPVPRVVRLVAIGRAFVAGEPCHFRQVGPQDRPSDGPDPGAIGGREIPRLVLSLEPSESSVPSDSDGGSLGDPDELAAALPH